MQEITIAGKVYPCRPTMGAFVRFKRADTFADCLEPAALQAFFEGLAEAQPDSEKKATATP